MIFDELLAIASPATSDVRAVDLQAENKRTCQRLQSELQELLSRRNGFYAFEGALHFLPSCNLTSAPEIPIQAWNEFSLWRSWYQDLTADLLFFAEDIFGSQFAISNTQIVSFDPESAEILPLTATFGEFVHLLMHDGDNLTGFPIAHSWQVANGAIARGSRLIPKVPFVLGGNFEHSNLFSMNAVKGMRYRGEIWQQIKNLPDGAQVRLGAFPTH